MIEELHCVQVFQDDIWRTIYVSSYGPDSVATYTSLANILAEYPLRLALFVVKGVDFIPTNARDFKVLARTA